MPDIPLTKSQVNKAGRLLRKAWRGEELLDEAAHAKAIDTVTQYRAAHAVPLNAAQMGLRSKVRTATRCVKGAEVVTQRLKRVPTISDKLVRHPTMGLTKMQDIAGCRAVVDSIAEIRSIEERYDSDPNRKPVDRSDYITNPAKSGYRGLHLIVDYNGYLTEIQLRTVEMHQWAIAVEDLGAAMSEDLKSGLGPDEVLEWLAGVSQVRAIGVAGGTPTPEEVRELKRLWEAAWPLMPTSE